MEGWRVVNANLVFEIKAAVFASQTGSLAPGKDAPPGENFSREERQRDWIRWLDDHEQTVVDTIRETLRIQAKEDEE